MCRSHPSAEGVQNEQNKVHENTSSNPITGRLQFSCKSLYDKYTPPRRSINTNIMHTYMTLLE